MTLSANQESANQKPLTQAKLDEAIQASLANGEPLGPHTFEHTQFEKAQSFHQEGQFDKAQTSYLAIIKDNPEHAKALGALGILYIQLAQYDVASQMLHAALKLDTNNEQLRLNLATAYLYQQSFQEARNESEIVLENYPGSAIAHNLLGTINKNEGNIEAALASYQKAITLKPDYIDALNNRATIFKIQGEINSAINDLESAIKIAPDAFVLTYNLGNMYKEMGEIQKAITQFEKALAQNANFSMAWNNLGQCYCIEDRVDEALKAFQQAVANEPTMLSANNNIAVCYCQLGLYQKAENQLLNLMAHQGEQTETLSNLAEIFLKQEKFTEAEASAKKALVIDQNCSHAYHTLALIDLSLGKLNKAFENTSKALNIKPSFTDALNTAGTICCKQGRIIDGVEYYRKAIDIEPGNYDAHSNILLALNYENSLSESDIFEAHLEWDAYQVAHHVSKKLDNKKENKTAQENSTKVKTKLGFVSGDFKTHSAVYFIHGFFEHYDKEKFEITCYSNSAVEDDTTALLKAQVENWTNISGQSFKKTAQTIQADNIDILFDLSGHTSGNRLISFAYRPAKIQVSWIGYPNTTGLNEMDYRLVDEISDPGDSHNEISSETLLRLSDNFLSYSPIQKLPKISRREEADDQQIRFGCFNDFSNFTDDLLAAWYLILQQVPNSILVVKNKSLLDEELAKNFREYFSDRGIAHARINILPWQNAHQSHMKQYNKVDISLDTFPFNGATTTCESLIMGVPVVARQGERHASRVSSSILHHAEMNELIGKNWSEYVEIACLLSEQIKDEAFNKENIRKRFQGSSMCDTEKHTRTVEALLTRMLEEKVD